jgi:hypothetical protein
MVDWNSTANKIWKVLKAEPVFCALVAFAYIIFIFHITSATGSWVTYSIKNQYTGYMTEIKIGLFNSATNNSWYLSPYPKCVEGYKMYNLSAADAANRQMFCDASLASAVLLIISLLLTLCAATLLLFIVSDTILENVVVYMKRLCIGIYMLSGKPFLISVSINMIAMSLGAGILYRLTQQDFQNSYYGVGFIATVLNFIFCGIAAAGTYFMIDRNGFIITIRVPYLHQDKDERNPIYY